MMIIIVQPSCFDMTSIKDQTNSYLHDSSGKCHSEVMKRNISTSDINRFSL